MAASLEFAAEFLPVVNLTVEDEAQTRLRPMEGLIRLGVGVDHGKPAMAEVNP